MMKTSTLNTTFVHSNAKTLPALGSIALGLTLILGLGFMQDANSYLHNAAHDGRHSAAFPCH